MNRKFKRFIAVFALFLIASSGLLARPRRRGGGGRRGGHHWRRGRVRRRHHGGRRWHRGGRRWRGRGWRRGSWGWGGPYWGGYYPGVGLTIGGGTTTRYIESDTEQYSITNQTNSPVEVRSLDSGDQANINPGETKLLSGDSDYLSFTVNGKRFDTGDNNITIVQGRYGPVPR